MEVDAMILERKQLAIERMGEIADADEKMWMQGPAKVYENHENLKRYFDTVAEFLLYVYDVEMMLHKPGSQVLEREQLEAINHRLYEDILPEHYGKSFGNPAYATECLGDIYGPILCALYAELRCSIVYAYEEKTLEFVSLLELFLEVYGVFLSTEEEAVDGKVLRDILYYYMYDYADVLVYGRILETISSEDAFARDIVMNSDLRQTDYLYAYGEYIGANEIETAQYLAKLPEERVRDMAKTYVDGFIKGYETMRIDLSPKKTVNIRYAIGQEKMVRYAIEMFENVGLQAILCRYPVSRINRKLTLRPGYAGTPANKQYDYDHRMDDALFLDRAFAERKLEVMEQTYEGVKKQALAYGGPAVIEVFGEQPFEPETKTQCCRLSEKQQKISVDYSTKAAQITNRYLPREQYSFTIIAYPIPEIGEKFEEIFDAVVEVNTLDNEVYRQIQQSLIDCLDDAQYVEVLGTKAFGTGDNETNMKVMLHEIDKSTQTNFENCLADVNIPLGEVFTSPQLEKTNGILHVGSVYLNELKYIDLKLWFEDGKIVDYTCSNFDSEEENKAFIKENLLFNHKTLPIGEFAIGTNTTAYRMAKKYDILYKLPILIVEKMGPHFAVGDTCYSYSEESRLYNPDGKEIVAKDNSCSLLRKSEDPKLRAQAYFNCHTDITIPYEELGAIYAVRADGSKTALIEHGRFVLPGAQLLNEALE
ncbi:MAG: aminopeptidase [Wujia sp.]